MPKKAVKAQLIEARIEEYEKKGQPPDIAQIADDLKTSKFYVWKVKNNRAKRLAGEKVTDALNLLQ